MKKYLGAIGFTLVTYIGSFLPVIFSALSSKVYDQNHVWPSFTAVAGKGEVLIICVPLIIGVLYSLYLSKDKFGLGGWGGALLAVNGIAFLVSTFLYVAGIDYAKNHTDANPYVVTVSGWLILITLLSTFFSKIMEDRAFSVTGIRGNQLNDLESRVISHRNLL